MVLFPGIIMHGYINIISCHNFWSNTKLNTNYHKPLYALFIIADSDNINLSTN